MEITVKGSMEVPETTVLIEKVRTPWVFGPHVL